MANNGLPGVNITVENGALGRVATTRDGVAGMILVGMSKPNCPLYVPKQIFGLKEAESLGFTAEADVTDKVDTYQQIKEFYDEAGNGAELWIMTVPVTRTMTELMDASLTSNTARLLLDAAQGRIRLLGISRYIDATVEYEQDDIGGMDEDVHQALPKANAMALEYRDVYKPFHVFIDGRGWNGVVSDLVDLRTYMYPKTSVVLATTKSAKTSAAIGLVLGRAARLPVQRNIGRVKDGPLNCGTLYFGNGSKIESYTNAQIAQIYSKGYITPRIYVGKTGYFLTDDPTATGMNDDFLTIANNRVIDKALTIVYSTYVNEINDEIEMTEEGKLSATKVTYFRQILTNALNQNMLNVGEVSNVDVYVDPEQNVLANDKLTIVVRIVPVGYAKQIEVSLGFQNPSLPVS